MRCRWVRSLLLFSIRVIALTATSRIVAGLEQDSPTPLTFQNFKDFDRNREQYQRATDILRALALSTGDWVADVGAGNGYYSQRLAELVGPTGKVFAEDISDYSMNFLNQRVKLFALHNVEMVKGDSDDPKLPADSLSGILIVDAYHHFSNHEAMLTQMLRALKPSGRLVIADYSLSEHRNESRADQVKIHEIAPELVRAEIEWAGFRVLILEDPFMKRVPDARDSSGGRADLWLIISVRSKP